MRKIYMLVSLIFVMPLFAQGAEYTWKNDTGVASLSSLKGTPVILHFWASWCPPCRSEMPSLITWIGQHPTTKVVVISLDNNKSNAEHFFKQTGIHMPINMGSMSGASALGVRGLPSTLIIDEAGEVIKRFTGDVDWADEEVSQQVLRWL